jgi:surfactin synthase thioesterase subunit
MTEANIVAIHFAGGNRYSLQYLRSHLPPDIGLAPVELPGRGIRLDETLLTSVADIVADLRGQCGEVAGRPFVLFGHCMGGLLAFLLARRLMEDGGGQPLHLFVSGCGSPARIVPARTHLLADGAFKEILPLFNISPALLESEPFYEMIAPVMRADLQAYNEYCYEPGEPLAIPVTVILEKDDGLTADEARLWQEETVCPVGVHRLSGSVTEAADELAILLSSPFKSH